MTVKVIGAGFGRTGTNSLKLALEQLGFDPCYHMEEVFKNDGDAVQWHDFEKGVKPDWDRLLGRYQATCDWPSCHFWREQAEAYPDAKILLTERDSKAWYKSIAQTIFARVPSYYDSANVPGEMGQRLAMICAIVAEGAFGGKFDEDHAIAVYRAHNEAVKHEVPKDRLLIHDSPMGWEPLCEFLGVPVPETPYPNTNTTKDFRKKSGLDEA